MHISRKKIRGLKRRQKAFEQWFEFNKVLDLKRLKENGYTYAKAKFGPWARYDASPYPSVYRKQLFSSLLVFYFNWKSVLDQEFVNYYLRIWLFNPRFMNSQVIAAIGDKIDYYENLFEINQPSKTFPFSIFNHETETIQRFIWQSSIDGDYYAESEFKDLNVADYRSPEDFYTDQRFYRKLMKENLPFRLIKNAQSGQEERLFCKKKGELWIGESRK